MWAKGVTTGISHTAGHGKNSVVGDMDGENIWNKHSSHQDLIEFLKHQPKTNI